MSLYQSQSLSEQLLLKNIYKTYTYGSQGVGKTNIITRFVKDEFIQAHNMTLQGQQSSILTIDGRKFYIIVHDTAGQQNLNSMKAVWRGNKDGYIFVYAIDNKNTFKQLIEQIIQIKSNSLYKNIPSIVIGNKQDLNSIRQVQRKHAQNQLRKFNMKLFQISAKTSLREQLEKIFVELIEMNQINIFSQLEDNQNSQNKNNNKNNSKRNKWPCCGESQNQNQDNNSSKCEIL